MDLLAKPFDGSVKRYWRRRKYRRLDGDRSRRLQVARLGGNAGGPRRSWKIKIARKLRLRTIYYSPFKIFVRLRDTYINMMVRLAGKVGSLNTDSFFGGKRVSNPRKPRIVYSSEEVEARLVYEIYKALQASRELSNV
ncbi:hypothetical protein ACJRO7_024686 [Eucalyptus globulus]|uniref:Uncharacterized protein n=1 Tax=Eucalyptus globulus TaxID=34317 RepID=A0ABD3K6D9_EUCGL